MNKTYNDFADIFLAVKRIESDYASLVTGLADSMEEIERLKAESSRYRKCLVKIREFKRDNPFVSHGDFDYILDLVIATLENK
jgi:hypothetical protein